MERGRIDCNPSSGHVSAFVSRRGIVALIATAYSKIFFLLIAFFIVGNFHNPAFAKPKCNKDNYKDYLNTKDFSSLCRNLRGADLSNMDLRKKFLYYTDLREANLSGAKLDKLQLNPQLVKEADFSGASWKKASLGGQDWSNSHFPGVNFNESHLTGVRLQGANLSGAQLQGAFMRRAKLQNADLQRADLQGVDLRHVQFQGANLSGANLQGVAMWETNFQNADLQRADFKGARTFRRTDFSNADLRGANLEDMDLLEANLKGADLRGANLDKARNVKYANFTSALVTPEQAEFLKSKFISGFKVVDADDNEKTDCDYNGNLVYVDLGGSCGKYCYGQAQCKVKGFDTNFSVFCKASGKGCPSLKKCIAQKTSAKTIKHLEPGIDKSTLPATHSTSTQKPTGEKSSSSDDSSGGSVQ